VLLGLSLAGNVVVQLSPPAYRGAANLIPFASFAFIVYGVFVIVARTTYHRHRDFVHNGSAALGAVVYLALSAVLVPRWGGYGVATAAAIGMAIATVCFRLIVPGSTHHATLEWPRLVGGGMITFACLVLGKALPIGNGLPRIALGIAVFFVIYPAAMILLRVVPRAEARVLRSIARGVLDLLLAPLRPTESGTAAAAALTRLNRGDVELLRELIKDRVPTQDLAMRAGLAVSVLNGRAARALLAVGGLESSERDDPAIGHWLFDIQGSAERDVVAHFLTDHGLPLLTLQRAESALATLKALPRHLWPSPSEGANGQDAAVGLEATIGIGH
jgi:hypothetical protein